MSWVVGTVKTGRSVSTGSSYPGNGPSRPVHGYRGMMQLTRPFRRPPIRLGRLWRSILVLVAGVVVSRRLDGATVVLELLAALVDLTLPDAACGSSGVRIGL